MRVLKIRAKVNDRCSTQIPHLGLDHEGYPLGIQGICHGDYIDLEIDLDTGKILNYKTVSDETLKDLTVDTE
jgi:hypothetical protein